MVKKTEKRQNFCTNKGECSAAMEGVWHLCTFYKSGYKEFCAWGSWHSSGCCTCKDAKDENKQSSIV